MSRANMTNGQRMVLWDRLNAHTVREVRTFHNKYGCSSLGYASRKSDIVDCVVGDLDHQGYDYEVALSMVETPSSYQ